MIRPSCLILLLGLVAGGFAPAQDETGIRYFAEKVHPLLEKHCYKCHGGGDELKGDFRLTSREGLMHGGHYGAAFNPDDPAASVLLEMVSYIDADHQMPPKGKLSEEELAILAHWMDMGAPYDPALEIKGAAAPRRGFTLDEKDRDWWAYRPIADPAVPEVKDRDWSRNGIDAFVRARLETEGLVPNPMSDPAALLRRVAYDVTGLPPTLAEVEAFVTASERDPEAAWAAVVDDLLSRPQYGEKWARHWLDLVRYAESNGFERDNAKPEIWRYRDYVVEAFNSNLPYDRFVIEQLAGDEIAEPTMGSLVATGYHRLMQWDDEPADREQHLYDVLADNVQVTAETFLASTLGCARCHDHKADPFSQRDYYSFMSFFRGVTHYRTEGTLVHWADEREKAAFETERVARIAELERERDQVRGALQAAMEAAGLAKAAADTVTLIEDARTGSQDWLYTTSTPAEDWHTVGFVNKSWFKAVGGFGKGSPPGSVVRTEWNTKEIWLRTTFGLNALPDQLVMDLHHDEDVEIYLNGTRIFEAKGFTTAYQTHVLPPSALAALQTGKNVIAVHCRQTGGGQYIDLSLRTGASGASAVESLLTAKDLKRRSEEIRKQAGRDLVGEYKRVNDAITSVRQESAGTPINAVTEAGGTPGVMHIHLRGSAHAPGDEVSPGLPAVLASADSKPHPVTSTPVQHDGRTSSGRRLELAKWIVSPENPLTARVMVNRLWQHHFGRGIVPTSSDFGKLGEAPSHPELLDWLATRFRESGWDVKAMQRMILLSRAYRLSSEPDSGSLQKDPQNHLLWRHDMRRLTAEELRDSILAVSGTLNLAPGGPWVYPPLPAEVLATASRPGAGWPVSKEEQDHYRRSLYVHVKRSLRDPLLADFDQADTDTACAVRFATTVPTQALTFLNSAFINEQARLLATRMRDGGGTLDEQIGRGLAAVLQRQATADEIGHLRELHARLRERSGLDEAAALDRIALVALNLNEFIYLD